MYISVQACRLIKKEGRKGAWKQSRIVFSVVLAVIQAVYCNMHDAAKFGKILASTSGIT